MYENIEFIIACGGRSTRNFPHSKGVAHKALMPFGDIRLIDFVLKDIIKLGGRHITFVCSSADVIDAFKFALGTDTETEAKLRTAGKTAIADVLKSTFLPADTDVKYVIQDKPLGTAHVLGLAHRVSPTRDGVLIFPDDLIYSPDENNTHLKRIVDSFLETRKDIVLTGLEKEDVSNNAILSEGRLTEKPLHPANHIGIYSPYAFPKETLDFIERQLREVERTGLFPASVKGKEWVYVDGINDFLDSTEGVGYQARVCEVSPDDELIDTGTLPLYELAQIRALLEFSRFKEANRALAKELLGL